MGCLVSEKIMFKYVYLQTNWSGVYASTPDTFSNLFFSEMQFPVRTILRFCLIFKCNLKPDKCRLFILVQTGIKSTYQIVKLDSLEKEN